MSSPQFGKPSGHRNTLREALATQLQKQPDDCYVKDLACVLKDSAPELLELLYQGDGFVEFTFDKGELFLITKDNSRRLLP